MTDVLLFQTNDNGEIEIEGGQVTMTDSLETAVYLSLFGGNIEDDGSQDNRRTWWGNLDENEPANEYRSETQYLLGTVPAVSANLKRIEDAATRDLQWLEAGTLEVSASLTGLNRVKIDVTIDDTPFSYSEDWRAGA
jgi:phage gp46-like protein